MKLLFPPVFTDILEASWENKVQPAESGDFTPKRLLGARRKVGKQDCLKTRQLRGEQWREGTRRSKSSAGQPERRWRGQRAGDQASLWEAGRPAGR